MSHRFRDRTEAGLELAEALQAFKNRPEVFVLGLPRGGVPVAFEVAQALGAPLDVFVVRKLGVPGHEELAFGAIASGGIRVLNEDVVRALHLPDQVIEAVTNDQLRELEHREHAYRGARPPLDIENRIVLLIDDGLATGATLRAAVAAARSRNPRQVVVAVPVAAAESAAVFEPITDQFVCLSTPSPFQAVGIWYDDFSQITDEDVRDLLARARSEQEDSS